MRHPRCTWPDDCAGCDTTIDRAEHARAERDHAAETWNDDADWSYTPEFGQMLTEGGW